MQHTKGQAKSRNVLSPNSVARRVVRGIDMRTAFTNEFRLHLTRANDTPILGNLPWQTKKNEQAESVSNVLCERFVETCPRPTELWETPQRMSRGCCLDDRLMISSRRTEPPGCRLSSHALLIRTLEGRCSREAKS